MTISGSGSFGPFRVAGCGGMVIVLWVLASGAFAGEADVVSTRIQGDAEGGYRFEVTVRHEDTGWEHYADRWEVLSPEGEVLGTRVLHHPHVGEQPFTRSLSGVKLPADVGQVRVRARDSVHGYGGEGVTVKVPR